MPSKLNKTLWCVLILFSVYNHSRTYAEEPKTIRITDIRLAVRQHMLVLNFTIHNLLNDRVSGTIQSGLPAILEYQVQILNRKRKKLYEKRFHARILYHLWDERYTVQTRDTTEVFTSFAELSRRLAQCRNLKLVDLAALKRHSGLRLRLRAGILPISGHQSRKLSGWLEAAQTGDDLTSEEADTGFKINISRLVSFFMGSKNGGKRFFSNWHEFKFSLSDVVQ